MPKRKHMMLDKSDGYFLNTLKKIGREDFSVPEEFPDDVFVAVLDYLNRLSIDYTALKNNKKIHEDKRDERVGEIVRNANAVLKFAKIELKENYD